MPIFGTFVSPEQFSIAQHIMEITT